MANAPPTEGYHRALIAVDLSEGSADWVKAALDLGLIGDAETTVLHAFRSLAQFARVRSALNSAEAEVQIEEDRRRAESQLNDFLASAGYAPTRREVRLNVAGEATTINEYASARDSDLIVLGTRQRTGPAKVILGSVAEEVLRTAQRDVLVIPVSRDGEPGIAFRDVPS
jgi:nucleotide-binding universal stress UspA family protein